MWQEDHFLGQHVAMKILVKGLSLYNSTPTLQHISSYIEPLILSD